MCENGNYRVSLQTIVSVKSPGSILFANSITAHLQEVNTKFSPKTSIAPPCDRSKLYFEINSTNDGYYLSLAIPDWTSHFCFIVEYKFIVKSFLTSLAG